ncbi:MAG: transporter [Clostridiales bacterium]|nr:transporter [Clostridiales bacterium]
MTPRKSGRFQPSHRIESPRPDIRSYLFLHLTLLLYSLASVFAKYAGLYRLAGLWETTLVFVGLEFLALLVYTLLWQLILRRVDLSFAYSNRAVCTLWTILFGLLFFGEEITWGKAVGILVVLAGVVLVVTDHDR